MRGTVRSVLLLAALLPVITGLNAFPGFEGVLAEGAARTYTDAASAARELANDEPAMCHAGTACTGVPLPGATAFALFMVVVLALAVTQVRRGQSATARPLRGISLRPSARPPRMAPSFCS